MSDPTVKIDIPFQTLVDALSKLNAKEKQKIWALLDAELYQNDECSPEELADIEAAQADYAVGKYITFEQYQAERKTGKV